MEWQIHVFSLLNIIGRCALETVYPKHDCSRFPGVTMIRGSECNSYLICYMGFTLHQGWCVLGTGFDPFTRQCTLQAFLKCQKDEIAKNSSRIGEFVCPRSIQEAIYPDYSTGCPTSKYFICQKGIRTMKSCHNNSYFHEGVGMCSSYIKSSCDINKCPQGLLYGVFADYNEGCPPKRYFMCLGYYNENGQNISTLKYDYSCPNGLYYNEGIKNCDFIQNVPCQHNIKNRHIK